MINKEAVFTKDTKNKKLTIVRGFDAPLELVWRAWTDASILDQWWAPKPYRAQTKGMDFKPSGHWLYSMTGPKGDTSWCKSDFTTVDPYKTIGITAYFVDEDGTRSNTLPAM